MQIHEGEIVDEFEDRVRRKLADLKVAHEAKQRHRIELAGDITPPAPDLLTDLLADPDPAITYRIDGLHMVGGNVLLSAQYKTGKSTLMGNLARSLVDVAPFLGIYDVNPVDGRVVILDNELDRDTIRRWLRDHRIVNTDSITVYSLRGRVASMDITNDELRARWARELRDLDCGYLILDCLRPVLDNLGLSEDKDVGIVLDAFASLREEAGISEGLVVHHAGHAGERSRGSSRLRDWPDAEWFMVREDPDDPASPRYFRAYGRDVDVPETLLHHDPDTRRLTLEGGNRKDNACRDALPQLLALLRRAGEPLSKGEVERLAKEDSIPRAAARSALGLGCRVGAIRPVAGRSYDRFEAVPEAHPPTGPENGVSAGQAHLAISPRGFTENQDQQAMNSPLALKRKAAGQHG